MASKVRVSPQDGANMWQQQFGASSAKYQSGVNAVDTAPNAKAAAALPKWIAAVTSKRVQDKFVAKNNAVDLTSWKTATITFGVPNLSRGAQKGQPKYAKFAASFYPFLSDNLSKIAPMPSITLEDNIARAAAMMRLNAQYKQS